LLGSGEVGPQQANQVSPQQVQEIAANAQKQNPSVVDQVSSFYAQHPQVVKALGGLALAIGIGAYTHVFCVQDLGLPWIVSVAIAAILSAAAGVIVGTPALRMTGVYLTIATLAFALIIQEIFTQWDRVTGGLKGKAVDKVVGFVIERLER